MPKKPATPFTLNMRNSHVNKSAMDYLSRAIQGTGLSQGNEYYLSALNLKFCFLAFEQFVQLADALRFNKTLVKLDLSNNCLKSCTARYILDSLAYQNRGLTNINFHGNLLDDDFAVQLSNVLAENPVLHKVDISQNPIGPRGAKAILSVLLEMNQTLSSLGDLSHNEQMGVRVREEIKQALQLNNSSHDKKKAFIEQFAAETRNKFIDSKELESEE